MRLRSGTATGAQGAVDRARAFGVDVTLLQAMLRLSPAERLARLDDAMAAVAELRAGVRDARLPDSTSSRGMT